MAKTSIKTNMNTFEKLLKDHNKKITNPTALKNINVVINAISDTDSDIIKAIDMGIYALNAESLGEIRRINKIASTKNIVMDCFRNSNNWHTLLA